MDENIRQLERQAEQNDISLRKEARVKLLRRLVRRGERTSDGVLILWRSGPSENYCEIGGIPHDMYEVAILLRRRYPDVYYKMRPTDEYWSYFPHGVEEEEIGIPKWIKVWKDEENWTRCIYCHTPIRWKDSLKDPTGGYVRGMCADCSKNISDKNWTHRNPIKQEDIKTICMGCDKLINGREGAPLISHGYCKPCGEALIQSFKKVKKNPIGQCFPWDFRKQAELWKQDIPVELVHAVVKDPWTHKQFSHAWIERNGRVYDWQTVEVRKTKPLTIKKFKEIWKPTKEQRYTRFVAIEMLLKQQHLGPWI